MWPIPTQSIITQTLSTNPGTSIIQWRPANASLSTWTQMQLLILKQAQSFSGPTSETYLLEVIGYLKKTTTIAQGWINIPLIDMCTRPWRIQQCLACSRHLSSSVTESHRRIWWWYTRWLTGSSKSGSTRQPHHDAYIQMRGRETLCKWQSYWHVLHMTLHVFMSFFLSPLPCLFLDSIYLIPTFPLSWAHFPYQHAKSLSCYTLLVVTCLTSSTLIVDMGSWLKIYLGGLSWS